MPVPLLGSPNQRDTLVKKLLPYFTPNECVPARAVWWIVAGWFTVWLGYWTIAKPDIFPSPLDVVNAFPNLWFQDGLGEALVSSFTVNLEAMALSIVVALSLAYVSRVPAFTPLADGFAKLRFLSPAVFFLILLYVTHTGHQVKVLMLTLGEAPFLATTMIGVVQCIPDYQFDDARTLRMSEWQSVWYVVIRGTLAQAIDAIRDNAAMGWSMLIMVEGIVRSEGGVGVMLLNNEKHINFAEVYAIAAAILLVGIGQDYVIGVLKGVICPYTVKNA